VRPLVVAACAALATLVVGGCRDLSRFNTNGDSRYEGTVASAAFLRSGFADGTQVCVQLDTDHLQDAPGTISTSDGRFQHTPLRPVPQLWNDPLSTLSFGEGRVKNLMYAATPKFDVGDSSDVSVVVSLLQTDGVEVRILRGAPSLGDAGPPATAPLFGVFSLARKDGTCAY
jgi:hypothetical protein